MYHLIIGRCSTCSEMDAFASELQGILSDHPDLIIHMTETQNDHFVVELNGKIIAEKNGVELPNLSDVIDAVLDEVPMLV